MIKHPLFFSVWRRPTDPYFRVFKKKTKNKTKQNQKQKQKQTNKQTNKTKQKICYEEGNDVVKHSFTFNLKK